MYHCFNLEKLLTREADSGCSTYREMSKATELAQQYLETVVMASFLLTICSLVRPSSCILILLKSDDSKDYRITIFHGFFYSGT